jgi:site-specific recombinase XerC
LTFLNNGAEKNAKDGSSIETRRVCSSHHNGEEISRTQVKAGLPEDLVLYFGRHDYGTRILKRTGNLAAVMSTMGHKDVKTAMQYQHPELEIVRAALDQDTAADKRA